MPTCVSSFTAI